MSKERYSYEEFNNAYGIRDNERDMLLNVPLVVNMLNDNHKRIAELEEELKLYQKLHNELFLSYEKLKDKNEELEEQLKNAIVPKFKVGDKVHAIIDTFAYTDVLPVEIRDTHLLYEVWDGQDTTKQHFTRIFATEEEAQAKLEELQGERNGNK